MRIITAGPKYLDIDSYAGIIAYAELLRSQGIEALAVSTAPLNGSVTNTMRTWDVNLAREYAPNKKDTFTLIDVSEPAYFEQFVDLDRVDEVIDHHTGYEEFWKQQIGDNARIEFLGAACTLVYERWEQLGVPSQMDRVTANLLASGILDNTLNFLADATIGRDVQAYQALARIGVLSEDWPERYFLECQNMNLTSLASMVRSDTKTKELPGYNGQMLVGQMALWEAKPVLDRIDEVKDALSGESSHWFMNLISIGERKSYFISEDAGVQSWVGKTLGVTFERHIAVADRLWLRKEIFRAADQNDTK